MQYNAIQYDTIRYDTIRYDTIRYDTIRYDTIRFDTIRYDSIWFDTIRFDSIRFDLIRFDSILFDQVMTRHVTSYWAALSRIFSICHATSRYITLPYRTVKVQLCCTTLRYIACIQPSSSVHQLFLCNNNNRYQLSGYCGDRNGLDSVYMDRLFWKWPSSMCICDNR